MPEDHITPELEVLIEAAARRHRLPVQLVLAMVRHESVGGVTHAVRYEPGFYDRYIKGKTPNFRPSHCSWDTERIGRATSWGLVQIMGETARCQGFRGWFPELCVPEVGLEWGCLYLRRLADRYLSDGGWQVVCRAYNGGPGNAHNVVNDYPAKILALIPGGGWPEQEA
jgi:soluble lytic murein transglycosylase-like protein